MAPNPLNTLNMLSVSLRSGRHWAPFRGLVPIPLIDPYLLLCVRAYCCIRGLARAQPVAACALPRVRDNCCVREHQHARLGAMSAVSRTRPRCVRGQELRARALAGQNAQTCIFSNFSSFFSILCNLDIP